ncbi:UDP-3-O-acyl-N-acetylglucosamine deacetylase [bacterium]|nr:UDP-3-O-acyl-N-acetylglucosamine deacetylase [bacterium]
MKTVKSNFEVEGIGLMSGVSTTLEICPSDKKGIRFHKNNITIEAKVENVISCEHCVVIGDKEELQKGNQLAQVALIEHFMAALAIVDIEALDVYFKTPTVEIPILDGSAKLWVEKFNEIGIVGDETRKTALSRPVTFTKGKSSIVLIPSNEETTITYSVNFDHPELKNRWTTLIQEENLNEIVEARTFGYLRDLETFQKMGYSKGVTIENTVGLKDDGTYTTALRSEFEPIKHKILDIIGDLYLTGTNPLKLNAKILVKEAGHFLHTECAKIVKEQL